jgi:hypothetical protein
MSPARIYLFPDRIADQFRSTNTLAFEENVGNSARAADVFERIAVKDDETGLISLRDSSDPVPRTEQPR